EPWLLAGLMMASVLHGLAAASRSDLEFVLAALQAMVYGLFVYCNLSFGRPPTLTESQKALLDSIPADIRTVLSRLDLDPTMTRYACC
ncbi:hypothetical protein BV20DRAFT_908569, partial [Pilatotrama ljubarskyi]